ncbi:hypothetical protein ACH4ND_33515 [Streptomyces sp. NPDC017179]|uniref:hypothetical protein n=1 Tax=Streptomyces sp. NPDC017179 TaxID=3364979 RepID=UPI00379F6E7D
MTAELWRRLAAEAIGTALLVIFGAAIALAAIRKRFPRREVVPYVVAQLANVSGGTVVQPGRTSLQAGVAEAPVTALLLFTIIQPGSIHGR